MRKEKGFTLVELLIVVAIIGILAAIAIPQFNKYKTRGYVAALRSDLKNAHTSAQAYLTDYPAETVDLAAELTRGGWKPSQNISFKSGDMKTSTGKITLESTNLNNTNVSSGPAPTVTDAAGQTVDMTIAIGASSAEGKVAFDGTLNVPAVK